MRPGAGKVVYVGNQLRGYGNLIMIKHNEDYISAYAHNDKLMVNNGQSVKIGQQIATMGSSDADSVRLHFQIRLPGDGDRPAALFAAAGQ
ncbi:lipoprotein YgeR [Klebsiella michiganensis]|uniref:Lipoprotein YgeR n=1 Tax=Klebsiella michiganensis TaxID=1134687 RepID=A0A7H4PI57_9ENTR|nr:lipoprotein YgeR [Klebsiella michiganensis]